MQDAKGKHLHPNSLNPSSNALPLAQKKLSKTHSSGHSQLLQYLASHLEFPQRKMRNSLLRMSTPSTKHKTFNLDTSDPRSTITRHTVSMKLSPEESTIQLRNCVTTGSRERLLRYSQISEARIYRKIKTIEPLQCIDS